VSAVTTPAGAAGPLSLKATERGETTRDWIWCVRRHAADPANGSQEHVFGPQFSASRTAHVTFSNTRVDGLNQVEIREIPQRRVRECAYNQSPIQERLNSSQLVSGSRAQPWQAARLQESGP
jgi:hypothetical protein